MIRHSQLKKIAAALLLCASVSFSQLDTARAADLGDGPGMAIDPAANIGDVYFFLDPNDNTKAVLIMTVRGFIVPGEAVNLAIFDPTVHYRFEVYNAGTTTRTLRYDIIFSERTADPGPSPKPILQVPKAQTATIALPGGTSFTSPVLNPSLGATAPSQTVTVNSASGVSFFAGEVDDPFFFDIPGFTRYLASVGAGSPDLSQLARARDSFAGYNTLGIALRVPVAAIKGTTGNIIGVNAVASRAGQIVQKKGGKKSTGGALVQLDREGNPAINSLLVPFNRRNEYNGGLPADDAAGKFSMDITSTLQALGTDAAHIATLIALAVTKGDLLYLDVTKANAGTGGGSGANGFPNGRRLGDDVMDSLLNTISNGTITTGDGANANDVVFADTFPFLAAPHQPLASGTDDGTRN